MPEAEFWELIEVMDGGDAEDDFRRLSEVLAKRPTDDLVAFDADSRCRCTRSMTNAACCGTGTMTRTAWAS